MQNNEISFADKKYISGREYVGVNRIEGSLVVVKKTHPVGYQELVEVLDRNGNIRRFETGRFRKNARTGF